MATKAPVQVPGAPADTAAAADTAGGDASQAAGQPQGADAGPDPRDAEIAQLRAQLAAATAPTQTLVVEADGPNIRRYKAESKHLHLSADELHAKVLAGEVRLTDHHVLCKDGWYVNPAANAQANG